jgi:hypothetical protein
VWTSNPELRIFDEGLMSFKTRLHLSSLTTTCALDLPFAASREWLRQWWFASETALKVKVAVENGNNLQADGNMVLLD